MKDRAGRAWEFVIKSWANGTEHRRVYVLEQVSEYIKYNHLREGDAIGICADECGVVTIEVAFGSTLYKYPSWSSNWSCCLKGATRKLPCLHQGLIPETKLHPPCSCSSMPHKKDS